MVNGDLLWGKEITADMIKKNITDTEAVLTFPNLSHNLYQSMEKTAMNFPQKTALVNDAGVSCTYGELLKRCEKLAAYLYFQKGIKKGMHVGILMHNTIEYCTAFLSLSRLGAVVISLPSKFKQAEILALAKKAQMEFLICEKEYVSWFQNAIEQKNILKASEKESEYGFEKLYKKDKAAEEDIKKLMNVSGGHEQDPFIIMFTSGTTSQSKGVLLKNYQVMHAIETYRRILHITEKDVSVVATPIYHITGLVALLGVFLTVGGTLYLHKIFQAKRVIEDARKYGYTFIHASPTVFQLMLQEGEGTPEIPTLRSLACGSGNMSKDKMIRLHKWLPNSVFHTVYGLTETSSPGTIFPGDAAGSKYIGSSGWVIPGMFLKIVDEDEQELSDGTVGEILVKGCNVLEGYYGQDKLSDGWLHTGDLGYINQEQYLFVVDRKKDMINRGGEKIWCYDVENEIDTMEEVQNCAVVGIPDELYGEVAAALVEVKKGRSLTSTQIQEYLKTRIAKYKIPVKIKIVDEIPNTRNGKQDKNAVRMLLAKEEEDD